MTVAAHQEVAVRTAWPQVLTLLFIVVAAGAACDDSPAPDPGPAPPGEVVTAADGTRFAVEVVAQNLEIPWALAFTPDGRLFVTERPGRVRVFQSGQVLAAPALVLTDVAAVGEGGLLGIAVHPDFANNHFVFIAYTARLAGGSRETRVVRYREVGNTLGEAAVILDRVPAADIHDGARVRFGPDRKLYVTMGDTAAPPTAQDLGTLAGKILRLNDDGSVPGDNPLPGSPIFSYGHRNPQGIDWHPVTGEPWGSEHGQTGNDEINRLQPGRNYGWPVIEADQTRAGMETPILFFSPSIAPSGASFYTGTAITGFRGNLFVGALAGQHLLRVRFEPNDPNRVAGSERLLAGRFGRIRDVVNGPDGALYLCTSNRDGRNTPVAADDRIVKLSAVR
jgi:glucose/arabinose dehydrogenase